MYFQVCKSKSDLAIFRRSPFRFIKRDIQLHDISLPMIDEAS